MPPDCQTLDLNSRVYWNRRRGDAARKQTEGVRTMDHLDVVTVADQEVGKIGDEDSVSTEMLRRKKRRDQTEAHVAWLFPMSC